MRECPGDDVCGVDDLVLHEFVEHDEHLMLAPAPDERDRAHDVPASVRIGRARRGDLTGGEVAEEGQVPLDRIEEVREGARPDGQERLDSDLAEDGVNVLDGLGQLVSERLEVLHHIIRLCASAEQVEDALSRFVLGVSWEKVIYERFPSEYYNSPTHLVLHTRNQGQELTHSRLEQ